MNYQLFKKIMRTAEGILNTGGNKQEVEDFFKNRKIFVNDYQVDNFCSQAE